MGKKILIGAASAILTIVSSILHAANFSYTGTFSADDDVRLFNFTADGISTVELRTYGYGGGTQADGNVVQAGGFDPMLTLFNGAGDFIGIFDDGSVPAVNPDLGLGLDALFEDVLAAGDYTVALTQYGNVSFTTIDGFIQSGNPNYTSGFEGAVPCSQGQFCLRVSDTLSVGRSDLWALDIRNVTSAGVVPVPAAVWLFGSGLIGLIGLARRDRA